MLVRDVMTTDLVTVPLEASLDVAVRRMLEARVGSVIVVADGTPTGILTETDSLTAGLVTDRPFSDLPVRRVASDSLETIQPDKTLREAVRRMEAEGVKKFPVVEGMDLVGIVTMSDVVRNYDGIVKEAHALEEQREGWEGNRLREEDLSDLTRD